MKRQPAVWVALFVVMGIAFGTVPANAEFPERPIQLTAGFQVGGNVDAVARILAKAAGNVLGQPMVVENKPGAGGGVAAAMLKSAKPDGYTLCLNMATAYTFNPHIGDSAYTADDFTYIAASGKGQEAFVSSPDHPWKDWKSMMAEAKKRNLSFASMIPLDKVFMREVGTREAVKFSAVPTKGGAEVITAVMGKHVDFGFSGGLHYSYAKAGQMTVLAGLGSDRLADFPDVPTLEELGYGITFENYVVIAAPKGLPAEVGKKLSDAFAKAIQDPEYVAMMKNNIHWVPLYLDSAKIAGAIQKMSASYKKMIDAQK